MRLIFDLRWLSELLGSNTFIGLATLLTAFAAWLVYRRQKHDKKVDASRIILSQIRAAERKLKQIRKKIDGEISSDFPVIFASGNAWERYAYMFARDFDSDQLDEINNFFDNCAAIDELASKDNNFFWVTTEERARVVQQQLPQLIIASYDKNTDAIDDNKLDKLKESLLDKLSNDSYAYSPKKSVTSIKALLGDINKLSTTEVGRKFKDIGKIS